MINSKLFTTFCGLAFLLLSANALASSSYNDVLVVVNDTDATTVVVGGVTKPVSVAVGEYFRAQRNMPTQNLCHVSVPSAEYASAATYQTIVNGVKTCLLQTGVDGKVLSDSVNYIVLTKGMPIMYGDTVLGTVSIGNALYVDLTGLSGSGWNSTHPYYAKREQFTKAKFNMYLVTYLIGYNYDQTIALIDHATAGFGNTGKLVLDRGVYWGSYTKPWFVDARTAIEARGFQGVYDWDPNNDSYPQTYITDVSGVMMYHSSGSNDGGYCTAPNLYHLGFVSGAIGDTYVSTSGRTFNYDPTGGLSKFVGTTWTRFGKATEQDLPYHFTGPIAFDGTTIWAGTAPQSGGVLADGIYLFDATTAAPTGVHYTKANSGLAHNKVYDIVVDGNWVWIATAGGLSRYNKAAATWDDLTAFALAGKDIRDIEIDAAKNELWVAYNGGVKRFDRTTGALFNTFTTGNGLYNNYATSLALDTNAVWIATAGGLNRWDRTTGLLSGYTAANGLRDNNVNLVRAGQSKVWVGYAGYNSTTSSYFGVSALDKSAGTWAHYYYDPANPSTSPLNNDAPHDILIEPNDARVWVATTYRANVLTTSTGTWTYYGVDPVQDLAFDGTSVWISAIRSGQSLVADLIHDGITGVQGYVSEPYVTAMSLPGLLYPRYTDGFNLAESFYMASNEMRWMNIVVGDPKVSPFAPRVTTFTPVNGSSAVAVSAPVSVSFASPGMGPLADMDWASINANTVTVTAGGVSETLSFTTDRSTQSVKFNPTGFWKGGTTYTVTLKGGVNGIHNIAGAGIFKPYNGFYENDVTWTFTTEADADNDGLSDAQEAIYGTNPNVADTDGDGVNDGTEVYFGTNPNDPSSKPDLAADPDGDGLNNAEELAHRTNPNKADTDGDGVSDSVELYFNYAPDNATSKPDLAADPDGDGVNNQAELNHGTNPYVADTDGDGLTDGEEINTYGTDPLHNADLDGDGLTDTAEIKTYLTAYNNPDTDADGLSDGAEINTYLTNPLNADSDSDGLNDGAEVNQYKTNPLLADTDDDGMPDGWEVTNGLNPLNADGAADTDGDGVINYLEYYRGTDPRNSASFPTFSTFYVDGVGCNASGTPDGTQANPYCTIDDGIAAADGGDTVQVAGGAYTSPSPAISVPIILTAAPGQQVTFSGFYTFSSFTMSYIEWGKVSGIKFAFGYGVKVSHARNVIFENSIITGVTTTNALTINQSSRATARNLVIAGNPAVTGILLGGTGTVADLSNVTVTGNKLGINFGTIIPTVSIKNAIVYGNTTDFGATVTPAMVSYSLVGNAAFAGVNGNITADPQFVNAAAGDYHVNVGSPAIDAGNPADSYANEPQPNGCRINMGAYGNTSSAEASSDRDGDGIFGVCPLQTDLQVAITAPASVLVNGTVNYAVTVTNNGPSTASGIALSGLTGCNLPTTTLARNASTSCSVAVTATTVGVLPQTVNVSGTEADLVATNNSASVTTTVNPVADLSLSITDSPDPVNQGGTVTYSVTVANLGPSPATGIVLTGLSGCVLPSTLANGANASCTATVIATTAGTLTQNVSVSGAEYDPDPTNNGGTPTTTVNPVADLSIAITDSPDPVALNGTVTYSITVTNNGPSAATSVTATGSLPSCTAELGAIASGTSKTCMRTVTASAVGTLSQNMCASGTEVDLTSGNNCATATTAVIAPDLVPTALTVTSSGTNLLINDSVQNQGTAAAGSFDVSYYLSTDALYQASDALVCKRTITSLAVNASNPATGTTQTSCAIPAAVSTGMYYLISRVDSGAAVLESNEANNERANATALGIGPDLAPTAMSAAKSGSNKVLVSEAAKNQGNRNISGVTVTMRYYLSTDTVYGTGDIALASSSNGAGTCQRTLTTLSAGATSSTSNFTCYKPTGAKAGTNYYVLVVDDALNTVVEYAESNNGRATTGTIKW